MASIVKMEDIDGETLELEDFIVRARGFSYDTTATTLSQFFAGCDIKGGKHKGIHFIYTQKGRSNEAFVEFFDEDELSKALGFNKKYLGDRYVDVTSASREEMDIALGENDLGDGNSEMSTVVKLTGMPFTALHDDVATFFAGCDIAGGKKKGISFLRNSNGTASGGCFVEFLTPDDVKLALKKDKEYMGSRFCLVSKSTIELRDSELAKLEKVLFDLKEPIVKLKGLPFKASEEDIRNFFPELEIITIEMVLNDQGNCHGEAFIEFASVDDAKEALKHYKLKLLHRYVDVTKSSRSDWISMLPATEKIIKTADDLEEPIVKLDNLPAKVSKEEIQDFLFGLECHAIQIVTLPRGDCNGEAFVELLTVEDAAKALARHKQPLNGESGREKIVEISASSRCDWRREPLKPVDRSATSKQERKRSRSPVHSRKRVHSGDHMVERGRYSSTPRVENLVSYPGSYSSSFPSRHVEETPREYLVNMVGLPFSATEDDVKQFFHPIRMTQIEFLKNDRGQPRGIAVVGFYSQDDRINAMLRDKDTIGSRYVNLHVRNEPREYDFDFSRGKDKERPIKRDSYGSAHHDYKMHRGSYRETRRYHGGGGGGGGMHQDW